MRVAWFAVTDRNCQAPPMSSIAQRLSASIGAMRRTLGSRDLRRLLLAFVGFNLAEWGTWIAAHVFAYNAGGAAAAGLIAFIQLVPAAIAAPFVALLGDRFPRERVLVVGYVVTASHGEKRSPPRQLAICLTEDRPTRRDDDRSGAVTLTSRCRWALEDLNLRPLPCQGGDRQAPDLHLRR